MIRDDDLKAGKDTFAWTGHWWLPSSPDAKLPGVLSPTKDRGPSLEVMGSFCDEHDRERKPIEIIHGTTPAAQFVTLCRCSEGGSSYDARGQYRTSYNVELAVTGEHFPSINALTFQDLRIQYSTLIHWVSLPLVDDKATSAGSQPLQALKVRPPVVTRLYQGNGYVLTLLYSACSESTGPGITLSIYPGAHIALHWDAPRPLADSLAVVSSVRDFLAFATGLSTHVEMIRARPVRFTQVGHAHDMLLFHRSHVGRKAEQEPGLSLFFLEDVASNFEAVVGAWFQRGQMLQPVIDLHLAPVYNPQMIAESQFLTAIQALEAFHRRMRGTKELPDDQHEARMAQVLASAPENQRAWLAEKLGYSNEPSLRRRLKSLFDEFEDILAHFTLDRKGFAGVACNTRNYLTHYDPKLKDKAANGWDLWQLVYGTQLLVDIGLLHEFGVDRDKIPELAARRHMTLVKRPAGPTDAARG
ncbi:MAG: hypothetical protein IMZ44_23665 [Planctomycetes bacterium]|nr:hypothetical protein [Planctomycetota bacterium]